MGYYKYDGTYVSEISDGGDSGPTEVVNVKDYGAVGDGLTDDTESIRTARDVAKIEKKTLYFPAGTFLLHGCIQLYSGMHVAGAGVKTTIKKKKAITQNLTADAAIGDTIVYVSDASKFSVGHDVYIGATGWGQYADFVGKIISINTTDNSITVEGYPRHSSDRNAGLPRAVTTAGVVSQTFSMLCTFRYEDSGDDISISNLVLDGNYIDGEATSYQLSPVHIDPYNSVGSNVDGKGLTLRDLKVINTNADGLSMQNMGETTVDNCRVYDPRTEGIHPGFKCDGVNISNCYVYGAKEAGIFDCNNVHGLNISNCYFNNCANGIYGLEYTSQGTTINGCTFESCATGIRTGASTYGSAISGCAFSNCQRGIYNYRGSYTTISGCSFAKCTVAGIHSKAAHQNSINGNLFIDCVNPILIDVYANAVDERTDSTVISGNVIVLNESAEKGNATISVDYAENVLIIGNSLTGKDADIIVGDTTSGIELTNNKIVA